MLRSSASAVAADDRGPTPAQIFMHTQLLLKLAGKKTGGSDILYALGKFWGSRASAVWNSSIYKTISPEMGFLSFSIRRNADIYSSTV